MELIDKAAVVSVIVNTPTKNQHTDVLSALAFRTIEILNLIEKFSSIDAVPVVRYCDCKHCDIGTNYFESWCYCKAWRHSVNPTDFCSYGERK